MILAILLVVMTTFGVLWWFNHATRDCRKHDGMYAYNINIHTIKVMYKWAYINLKGFAEVFYLVCF